MFRPIKILFLSVVFCLQIFKSVSNSVKADLCPDAGDISPCVCTYYDTTSSLYMDCSAIQGDDELKQVFSAYFKETKFFQFRIVGTDQRVPITALTDDTFGSISFENIDIENTNLQSVSENALAGSHYTLKYLRLSNNLIEEFPFETLSSYMTLHNLYLQNNKLTVMRDITSTHLQYVNLNHNPGLVFSDLAFKQANNIIELHLEDLGLTRISPHFFSGQKNLIQLNMYGNQIRALEENSLQFSSGKVVEVILSNNSISSIAVNAFGGLFCPTDVLLENNNLEEIREATWKPVFEEQLECEEKSDFSFNGNPLLCDCSIAWIVRSSDYLQLIQIGTKCANGDEVHQLNPEDFGDC